MTDRPGTVLITGASSGIGRATALQLAEAGANLVLLARSAEVLELVRQECEDRGGKALVTVADIRDGEALNAAFAAARSTFGTLDAVVHSAGALAYGRFEDVPTDVFNSAIATTLTGTANVARCALREFREAGGGHLVFLGSLLGKISTPYMSSYVTAKWGVHGLVRTLQIEARRTPGIHISLVSPGSVDTPVYLQAGTYLGRHGRPPPPVDTPHKVASAVVHTLGHPRRDRSVGLSNHVVVSGFRLFPAVFDLLVTPLMTVGGLSRGEVPNSPGNVLEPLPRGEAVHGRWSRRWTSRLSLAGSPVANGSPVADARPGTSPGDQAPAQGPDASDGPGTLVPRLARLLAIGPRNVEALRRLASLAEGRFRNGETSA